MLARVGAAVLSGFSPYYLFYGFVDAYVDNAVDLYRLLRGGKGGGRGAGRGRTNGSQKPPTRLRRVK